MLWARCNIGANSPSDYGLYFSWGNLEGHERNSGYDFSQEVYDETPAAAITKNLSLNQDAARAYLGVPWRMPTVAEFKELYDNCTHVWSQLDGIRGVLFTSRVNDNSIFVPASGRYDGTLINGLGSSGNYWSTNYDSEINAGAMSFNSTSVIPQNISGRHYGFAIRAVIDPSSNRSVIPPTPEDEPKDEETPIKDEPKDENQR